MAEKKKVEREFVEASTGKTGKGPAVVTAANKKSATGKRVAAVILWVLALANFTNLQGLSREGNNLYSATLDSGQGTTNRANTGSVGSISGNTLESSNVDMATEMVNMIVTQRGFEANSKTITTVDSMLSEVIQLKR